MGYYLGFFIAAAVICYFITPIIMRLAWAAKLVKHPAEIEKSKKPPKSLHQIIEYSTKYFPKRPVALAAGGAYAITFLFLGAIGMYISKYINLNPEYLGAYGLWFTGVLVLLILGLIDDMFDLPGIYQFIAHFSAIILFVLSAFDVKLLHLPIVGIWNLDWWHFGYNHIISIVLPGDIFAAALIFIMLYSLKFQAGVEGVMEGSTAIALIFLFINALSMGYKFGAFLYIVLAGSLVGFIPHALYPAKVLSGSVGKSVIGYMVATLTVIGGASFSVLLGVFALPIVDMLYVLTKRFLRYKSIKKMFVISDQTHFHYRLMHAGLNEKQVDFFEFAYTSMIGIAMALTKRYFKPWTMLAAWLISFILILYVNSKSPPPKLPKVE